jgi:hypothetical protein
VVSVFLYIGDAAGGSSTPLTSNGLYTGQVQVAGAGTDIWGTADGFQFYYQQLVGARHSDRASDHYANWRQY